MIRQTLIEPQIFWCNAFAKLSCEYPSGTLKVVVGMSCRRQWTVPPYWPVGTDVGETHSASIENISSSSKTVILCTDTEPSVLMTSTAGLITVLWSQVLIYNVLEYRIRQQELSFHVFAEPVTMPNKWCSFSVAHLSKSNQILMIIIQVI